MRVRAAELPYSVADRVDLLLERLAGVGILEPVATHREHRRAGHGRRVVHAAFDALAAVGASGVAVCTPGTNAGAIGLYVAAGMRPIETLQDLTRTR